MYLPWPGFLALMSKADVLIWLDDVQYSKGSFTNRVQFLFNGKPKWLTISLEGKGSFQKISQIRPNSDEWVLKHQEMIVESLRNYPFRESSFQLFEEFKKNAHNGPLYEAIINSCEVLANYLDILPQTILRSSDLNAKGSSSERVLNLVKSVSGTNYITAHGAAKYLDHLLFEKNNVSVEYMDYNFDKWPQEIDEFTPYLSSLDLISAVTRTEAKKRLNLDTLIWHKFINNQLSIPIKTL